MHSTATGRPAESGDGSPHSKGMSAEEIAPVLEALGCPSEKCLEMAQQLDKRARQLAEQKGKTYDEALTHLLSLMKQGWSAKERGL